MDTEESKVWLTGSGSLKGDCLERMQTFVFLCTTTLQNPRAPRGFYGRTDGQFRPPPFRPCRFPCPKFPCPIRPHSRTAASRPSRWASAVRLRGLALGSFPLCVPSDLCGVPLRAPTIGAFPENTAEIGRNAERERAAARTAYSLRRLAEFCLHPGRPTRSAVVAAPPPCVHRVSGVASRFQLHGYCLAGGRWRRVSVARSRGRGTRRRHRRGPGGAGFAGGRVRGWLWLD